MAYIFESTPLFLTGVFIFGLLIGSFLNVVIYRLPIRLQHDWECQCRELLELSHKTSDAPPGIVKPRSRCQACGHQITALENIPVISYLFLRGKCSGCQARISVRYPIIEFLTGTLFLVVAIKFGVSYQTLAALVLTAFLVVLAGIDFDHQLLPDSITLPLVWIGLFISIFAVFAEPRSSILGAILGYLSLWAVFHLFKLLTGKEGMGYGDFKLLAALGAWLGWQMLPLAILVSSVLGALLGGLILVLSRKSKDQPIPFGPFIAAAGWVCMLWGEDIIAAYMEFSGIPS